MRTAEIAEIARRVIEDFNEIKEYDRHLWHSVRSVKFLLSKNVDSEEIAKYINEHYSQYLAKSKPDETTSTGSQKIPVVVIRDNGNVE